MTTLTLDQIRRALADSGHRGESVPPPGERYAAVAAVLRPAAKGDEVLLIRRAEHEGDPWSGHMAFPGGRHDPTDRDLLFTAVRETREELGLDLEAAAELLGRLDDLPAIAHGRRAGITIAPYIFELRGDPVLTPNHEVEEALWVPLEPLVQDELRTTVAYRLDGQDIELPAWDVDGRIVWGLTHRMLVSLFERARSAR